MGAGLGILPHVTEPMQGNSLPRIRRNLCETYGAATRCGHFAAWNRSAGFTTVKQRREGGHLCHDEPWIPLRHHDGSDVGVWRAGVGLAVGGLAEATSAEGRKFIQLIASPSMRKPFDPPRQTRGE